MKTPLVNVGLAAAVFIVLSPAASGQSLTGTVIADDTAAPLAGATVVAVQKGAQSSQSPFVYKATTDSAGQYAFVVSPSQYTVCVHNDGIYLDPCQWGGTSATSLTSGTASIPLRLKKGAWIIVRIHDLKGLLPAAEAVARSGVSVSLSATGVNQLQFERSPCRRERRGPARYRFPGRG